MNPNDFSLMLDLYELTMAQSYFQNSMSEPSTFSLYIRSYPYNRGYFVTAGLSDVITYLQDLKFTEESITYLESTGIFDTQFLQFLRTLHFTGDVWAIPEGGIVFADEPLLEITAPIIEAQIIETFIVNQMHYQTLIATNASRCVWAARDRSVIEFGLRRTHGIDAGLKMARASYMAGCKSTSNVLANKIYGIPMTGTMAHSFITSMTDEIAAFRAYYKSFPCRTVLLLDTYDTINATHNAVVVAKEIETDGNQLLGVRIDSGDLLSLSKKVRQILDAEGLSYVTIVASGGLDEYSVEKLLNQGAPIDVFAIGTKMSVSDDSPSMDMIYKQVRYADRSIMKLSPQKISLPESKQIFRTKDSMDYFAGDILGLRDENINGKPLLEQIMTEGKVIKTLPNIHQIRDHFAEEFECIKAEYKTLTTPPEYPVTLSPGLQTLANKLHQQVSARQRSDFDQGTQHDGAKS